MANIKTLYGSDKLREAYPKINENFNELNGDINVLRTRVNTIITTPIDGEAAAQELVDARDGEVTLGKRLDRDKQIVESHLADYASHLADYASHVAESATEEKLGHVIVDGKTILVDENGVISGAALTNKNLLHNWDFKNPINQRGEDVYTTSAEITAIDRWNLTRTTGVTATYTVSSRELKVVSGDGWASLTQIVENPEKYAGKTVNFSAEIESCTGLVRIQFWYKNKSTDPVSGVAHMSAPASGSPQKLSTSWTVPVGMSSTGYFKAVVQVNNGSAILNRAKLEMGNVSTLENDPPADYGEQLALCKRYFRLWKTEEARTAALQEVGLMRLENPTLGTINIGGTTYYYASADL